MKFGLKWTREKKDHGGERRTKADIRRGWINMYHNNIIFMVADEETLGRNDEGESRRGHGL